MVWLHLGTARTLLLAILAVVTFVARQIARPLRHLGSDEFVLALNGVQGADEVAHIVLQRPIPMIRQPHPVEGEELHLSCSVGIALFPDDAPTSTNGCATPTPRCTRPRPAVRTARSSVVAEGVEQDDEAALLLTPAATNCSAS